MRTTPLKILILEDIETDAELIMRLLKKEGCACLFKLVMTQESYINALGEFQPEVILSDNSLPQFTALEALQILQQHKMIIPFILVTGTVSEEFAATIIKLGADDYLLKDRLARLPGAIEAALKQKQAEKEKNEAAVRLQQSEEKYRSIMERVSDAFVALDKDWCYTFVNKKAAEIMGRVEDELLGKQIWNEYPEAVGQPFYEAYYKAMEEQQYVHLEEYYPPFDKWLENDIYPSPDGLSIFFKDVTERKRAERKIIQSEENLKAIFENTSEGFILTDVGGFVKTFNDLARENILLIKDEEIITGRSLFDFIEEERKAIFETVFSKVLQGERIQYDRSYIRVDGKMAWINFAFNPVRKDNLIIGVCITARDITEKKFAEQRKEFDSNNLHALINNTKDLMWSVSKDFKLITFNQAFDEVYKIMAGKAPENGIEVLTAAFGSERLARYRGFYERAFAGETFSEIEFYQSAEDIWSELSFYPIYEGDTVSGTACYSRNITESKKAEELLNQNQIFIESIINASPDIIYIYDIEERKNIYINEGIQKNLGYSEKEVKEMGGQILPMLLHPGDYAYYLHTTLPKYQHLKDKEIIVHEFPMRDKNKNWRWFYCKESVFLRNKEGATKQIFGITSDITERKKTELAMKESEEKYRTLVEQASDAIFITDFTGKIISVNKSACKLAQYPEDALLRMTIYDFAIMEDIQKNPFHFDELKEGKTVTTQRIMKRANDEILHVEITGKLLSDGRLLIFVRDISERIKAQNEIIKEKNLSDSIINSLPVVFFLYSKAGKYLRWNLNFEKASGYNKEEISNMQPADFFAEEHKALLNSVVANIFTYGKLNAEANIVTKNNEVIPYYFTCTAIEYQDEPCVIGVGVDFSEKIKAQEEITQTAAKLRQLTAHLQDIREGERKRIGREIHDELGQQLTAIKMDIAWIDKKIPDETTFLKSKLKNVITLLDGSNKSIRRILSELRPSILENHGLSDALHSLSKQFTENTGTVSNLSISGIETNLSEHLVICIFRVYQEALTNISKYAQASKVEASLNIIGDTITVFIEDNGKGFNIATVQNNKSFGLLGMKERVLSLGGKFELISSPGNGTIIKISLPSGTN